MPDTRQPMMEVKIGDKPTITKGIESIVVEDHDRLADKATVIVNDTSGIAADSLQNGMEITITMGWKGETATLFKGLIHQPTHESSAGAKRLTIEALDYSTLMHVEAKPEKFPPGTLKDVLTKIISKEAYAKKIQPGQIEPDPNPQWDKDDANLLKPSVTDLQFIQMLAVRHRARAFVEYCTYPEKGGKEGAYFFFIPEAKIAAQKAGAVLRCCGGFHEIIDFKVTRVMNSAAPYRPGSVIDPKDGSVATQDLFKDPPDPPAGTDPDREKAADAMGKGDAYRNAMQAPASAETKPEDMIRQLTAAGLPSDPKLAEALSQRDPTTVRGLRGRGTVVGNVHLRAKSRVTITGIATYAEGDWYIRVARHKIENGSYTTELVTTL